LLLIIKFLFVKKKTPAPDTFCSAPSVPCAQNLIVGLDAFRSFLSFGAGRLLGGGAEALHVGAGKTLKESDSSR
jgi:hypothetical protein